MGSPPDGTKEPRPGLELLDDQILIDLSEEIDLNLSLVIDMSNLHEILS